MRTKTLLLAVAALAAGISYSEAQNVYSQNIVGYVNYTFAGSGDITFAANPFNATTNDMISLIGSALPNKSTVSVFNPGTATFSIATKTAGSWNTDFLLNPGTGFIVKTPATSGPITNTWVGSVVIGGSQTNTEALLAGQQLAGSPVPVSGALTDSGAGTLNLGAALANKSTVSAWNVNSQAFTIATLTAGTWNTNLTLNVGDGFYVNSHAAANWVQILP